MDMNVKMETNINNEDSNESSEMINPIKLEPELIIESDYQWLPIKIEDEQNDYYQEYSLEFNEEDQRHCINAQEDITNDSAHQEYTIKYLDENDDDVDDKEGQEDNDPSEDDDDDDSDNEGIYNEDNMDREYNLQLELYAEDINRKNKVCEEKESTSDNLIKKSPLKYWLLQYYVQRTCPECNETFAAHQELRKHIELEHGECIKEAENDYYSAERLFKCKKCHCEFAKNYYIRYEHSVRHRENGEELTRNRCKICQQKLTKSIHTHFVEEHPEVVDEFDNTTNVKHPVKCPICHYTYGNNKFSKLWYHFMDKHPQEHQDKFRYNCHLCEHERFAEEETYLQHLMVEHELNSWQVLNFRKLFADKEYLACLKCHRVYLKNDTCSLLRHYLGDDSLTYWSCRFCSKKMFYKYAGRSGHMCPKMLNYYNRRHREVAESNRKNRIKSLQEFEKYIAHVCPFCKEEFNELLKWQEHLRNIHAIDTLKGLEMKVVANTDTKKLRCVICHTMVANTPVQLHAHRFQHLPFKPYKCRHCKQTLATFKMAVNHAVKRCKDEQDRDYINQVLKANKTDLPNIEIQCAFCNYQKFANAQEVFTHYKDEHNNFEEFFTPDDGGTKNLLSCIVCDKKFLQDDQHNRLEHLYRHFDEKTFKCPLCKFSYVGQMACICHMKKIHNIKPLEVIYSSKENTQNVKKESIKVIEQQPQAAVPSLGKPGLKSYVLNEFAEFISFACPECNEGMTSQEDWHTHITTQHDFFDESNVCFKDSINGTLKCLTCKINLPTVLLHRLKHKLTHMPYRSFICNLCYARFNSLGVLYGHFRRKHFAQGSFKCAICPEVLATSHQRTEHLKQTHPPHEWPKHMCLICYRILGSKSGLNTHMITHNGERVRYTCDVCGSKLVERKDFNNHVARHKLRGEIKDTNDDDIPSKSSGFVEAKVNVLADVKEEQKTDFDNVSVYVKSKKANSSNNKRKAVPNNADVRVQETDDVNNADIKSKKANLKSNLDNVGVVNVKSEKTNSSNNKRKSLRNDSDVMEQETDMDITDAKSTEANLNNNKRKSLRNSTKTKKCYTE